METPSDVLNPDHYKRPDSTGKPRSRKSISNMEVIDVIEKFALNFHLGNVIKYVLRAGKKEGSTTLVDLRKAHKYLGREISRLEGNPKW